MRKVFVCCDSPAGSQPAAYAQLPDAYVGAGVSQARIDDIFHSGHDFDLNNTAWKAFVGVRPIPFLGVEANYMDLGSESRRFGFNGAQSTEATSTPTLSRLCSRLLPLAAAFYGYFRQSGSCAVDPQWPRQFVSFCPR